MPMAGCHKSRGKYIVTGENEMGFFGMIASLLLGVFFIAFGISRRKQKVLLIILIALGVVFVLIALYLGWPK